MAALVEAINVDFMNDALISKEIASRYGNGTMDTTLIKTYRKLEAQAATTERDIFAEPSLLVPLEEKLKEIFRNQIKRWGIHRATEAFVFAYLQAIEEERKKRLEQAQSRCRELGVGE
jgi:hypothetical protein